MRSYGGNDVVANWCEVVERPDVTYDQLVAMVGTLVASRSRVERDLPRLNAERRAGEINAPEREGGPLVLDRPPQDQRGGRQDPLRLR